MACPKCDSPSVSIASNISRWLTCGDCGHTYERLKSRYEQLASTNPAYDPTSPVKPTQYDGYEPFYIGTDYGVSSGTVEITLDPEDSGSNLDE